MSREIDKNKDENHDKKELQIRSSAAEYLTFIAANGNNQEAIEIRYEDENIWLTQKMMAALYDVSVSAINQHLKKIFDDNELDESSVIKKYLITVSSFFVHTDPAFMRSLLYLRRRSGRRRGWFFRILLSWVCGVPRPSSG